MQTSGTSSLTSQTLGHPQVCVAVLDGLVDLKHLCFQGAALTQLPTLVSGSVKADGGFRAPCPLPPAPCLFVEHPVKAHGSIPVEEVHDFRQIIRLNRFNQIVDVIRHNADCIQLKLVFIYCLF